MGRMRLDFLQNASQRIASKRTMPTPQLEAIILFGTGVQRAKVLGKVLPNAAALAEHKETHHIVATVAEACDNTTRVELLFAIRRKVQDLARTRHGNVVLQKLAEHLPATQKKELAEMLLDEFTICARHMFGNRVLQTLLEHSAAADVLEDLVLEDIVEMAEHEVAQHVAAKAVARWPEQAAEKLVPHLGKLFEMPESAVLTALLKSPVVDADVQAVIRDKLVAEMDTFIAEGRHNFSMAAAIEAADEEDVAVLAEALKKHLPVAAAAKGQAGVVYQLGRRVDKAMWPVIFDAAVGKDKVSAALSDPYRSMAVRGVLEAGYALKQGAMLEVCNNMEALATNSAAAATLQHMMEFAKPAQRAKLLTAVEPLLDELAVDIAGSHVVQRAVELAEDEQKARMVAALMGKAADLMLDQHGTHTLQKAVVHATDEALQKLCTELAEEDILPTALERNGCFAIQGILRTAKNRGLLPAAREVVNALKPHVMRLATSRWAGRVVLDAVFDIASTQLRDMIRNVIFLKCEEFFSAPAGGRREGGDRDGGKREGGKREGGDKREGGKRERGSSMQPKQGKPSRK